MEEIIKIISDKIEELENKRKIRTTELATELGLENEGEAELYFNEDLTALQEKDEECNLLENTIGKLKAFKRQAKEISDALIPVDEYFEKKTERLFT